MQGIGSQPSKPIKGWLRACLQQLSLPQRGETGRVAQLRAWVGHSHGDLTAPDIASCSKAPERIGNSALERSACHDAAQLYAKTNQGLRDFRSNAREYYCCAQ